MKRLLVLGVLIGAVLGLAPSSLAEHVNVRDGNDVDGRLDLRAVEMREGPPRRWILKTHKAFSPNRIFDRGYLLVYFDTYGTKRFDYYVLLRPKRHKVVGELFKDRKQARDEMLATTKVRKPGKRSIVTTVPFREMRKPQTALTYRWHARTIYSSRSCKRVCIDRAPNARSIEEPFIPPRASAGSDQPSD